MIDYEKLLQKVAETVMLIEARWNEPAKYYCCGTENREDIELTEEEYNYLKQYTVEGLW